MNNLHITLTNFKHESRLLKEAQFVINKKIASKVFIFALYADGLESECKVSDGIFVERIKLYSKNWGSSLPVKIIKYLEFFIKVLFKLKGRDIGIINAHDLSLLPLAYFASLLTRAILIFDAHELETERNGLFGVRKYFLKILEKALIYKCDIVIVVGNKIADWYESTYKIDRPVVAMNCPRLEKLEKIQEKTKLSYFRDKFGLNINQKIFLYQGLLNRGRGLELLMEAFSKRESKNEVLVVMGYGVLETVIKDKASSCENIYFHEAVAADKLLYYTSSADFGLSIIESTCLSYNYCLPNKLFEYGMAAKPVLVSNLPEMSSYVNSHKNGVVVKSFTSIAINDAIDNILGQNYNELSSNARRASELNSWEEQEENLYKAYYRLLGK